MTTKKLSSGKLPSRLLRLLGAAVLTAGLAGPALAQGTLRIGMTASDIPLTTGQTDQGGDGMRFLGYTVYDGLINWALSKADKTRSEERRVGKECVST